MSIALANAHDRDLVPKLVDGATGQVIRDSNYWYPQLTTDLAPAGIILLAPFKKRASDSDPLGSWVLSRLR